MSTGSFAKEDVMEEYLSSLLHEDDSTDLIQQQSVQQLLASVPEKIEKDKPNQEVDLVETLPDTKVIEQTADKLEVIASAKPAPQASYRQGKFQALFFKLAGLTLAVPLTELGGIHNLEKLNSLFGKPDWFLGIQLHRQEKLSVVDSAKWVMPEKYNEKLAESLNYQYLIMLGESHWGLACESLIDTITLSQEDVKWREARGKRPWLAGLVKDQMCALVDVQQMIALLNQGHDSKDQ